MIKWFLAAPLGLIFVAFQITAGVSYGISYAAEQYDRSIEWAASLLPVRQVIQILPAEQVPVEQLIEQVSEEFGLNPIVIKAMALQESGGWNDLNRMKEEPQLLVPQKGQPAQIAPPRGLNDVEKLMWATSHGLLQVIYGFHYKTCELRNPMQLHDPLINLRCGTKVLRILIDKYDTVSDPERRLWLAYRDYNGSGKGAEAHADKVISHLRMLRAKSLPKLIVTKNNTERRSNKA